MKKIVLLAICIIGASASTFAQKGLHLGANFQPQATALINKNDYDEDQTLDIIAANFGVMGGIHAGYHFTDNFGLSLGLALSGQSQKYEGVYEKTLLTPEYNMTAKTKLSYFKVPLLFQLNTSPDATSGFSFFFGPQLNFLMSSKTTYEKTDASGGSTKIEQDNLTSNSSTSPIGTSIKTEYDKNPYNKTVFAVVLGFGANVKLVDNLFLNINLRFDYGLGDTENKEAKVIAQGGTTLATPYKVWDDKHSLFNSNTGYSKPITTRAKTTQATAGLNFGITYVLPTK